MTPGSEVTLVTHNPAETVALGRALASLVRSGDCIALIGELGAGKTQFIRGLAAGMGASQRAVSSPTFVLMQEYATKPKLIHIDAYRIRTLAEVGTLGWTPEVIEQSVSVIEWADRIADDLPEDRLDITLQHVDEHTRQITFRAHGRSWEGRLDALQQYDSSPPPGQSEKSHPCPICSAAVTTDSPFFPFCSSRCRMVDLGRWLGNRYTVSRDIDWQHDDLGAFDKDPD